MSEEKKTISSWRNKEGALVPVAKMKIWSEKLQRVLQFWYVYHSDTQKKAKQQKQPGGSFFLPFSS